MQGNEPDYYKTLGVSKDATQKDIKRAWRDLARKYHPDAQHGKGESERKHAEDMMKRINDAYSIIGDEKKRRAYDDYCANPFAYATNGDGAVRSTPWGDAQSAQEFATILETLFGGKNGGAYARDTNASRVNGNPFGDMFGFGGSDGMGYYDVTHMGQPSHSLDVDTSMSVPLRTALNGGRETIRTPDGKTVSVTIPKGTRNGQTIRLRGMGRVSNRHKGDMNVTISVDMPQGVTVDGDDIHAPVDVRFDEAILGGQVKVDLPSGKTVRLRVPKGTTAGKTFAIPHEGFGRDGRCMLKVRITVPGSVTKETEGMIGQISQSLG